MNVLSIDTATQILSVAISCGEDDAVQRYMDVRDVGLYHTCSLMPIVDALLHDSGISVSDIDLIACARGPGSFTGLRIGMATAKGLATAIAASRALDVAPLVSVGSLAAMAAALQNLGALVLPVIDARKKRFYGALYSDSECLTGPFDLTSDQIAEEIRAHSRTNTPIIVTGPDAVLFVGELKEDLSLRVDPACRRGWAHWVGELAILRLAQIGYDAGDQGPDYIRGSDAQLARQRNS